MRYFINAEPEAKQHVWQRIACACQSQGGDIMEAAGIWTRAHKKGDDGEAARDELTSYVPELEMIT